MQPRIYGLQLRKLSTLLKNFPVADNYMILEHTNEPQHCFMSSIIPQAIMECQLYQFCWVNLVETRGPLRSVHDLWVVSGFMRTIGVKIQGIVIQIALIQFVW